MLRLFRIAARVAEAVVEGVAGSGSVFTAAGRILDGHETTNYTLSRVAEANSALSRPSACLLSKWSAMRLDTPDHLGKCAIDSAVTVAGVDAAFSALTESLSLEGGMLLPAMETLDPQAVFFLQYAQSHCSVSSLQQRDLDRTVNHQLLGREKLKGVLSQFVEFKHFYFCSEDSEFLCDSVL